MKFLTPFVFLFLAGCGAAPVVGPPPVSTNPVVAKIQAMPAAERADCLKTHPDEARAMIMGGGFKAVGKN